MSFRDRTPDALLSIVCPACSEPVPVEVRVQSIATAGLSLEGVTLDAVVPPHPCSP